MLERLLETFNGLMDTQINCLTPLCAVASSASQIIRGLKRGNFPESRQEKHKWHCLFNEENLCLQAAMLVRENSCKKGVANMTAQSFCSPHRICLQSFLGPFLCVLLLAGSGVSDFVQRVIRRVRTWMVMSVRTSSFLGRNSLTI